MSFYRKLNNVLSKKALLTPYMNHWKLEIDLRRRRIDFRHNSNSLVEREKEETFSRINPCAYSISILKGFELKNEGVIKSFENKIKQNNSQPSDEIPEFPYTPHELKNLIWKGPWRVLFNAVFMKVHDYIKLNKNGYTIKYSSKLACRNGRLRMIGNHFWFETQHITMLNKFSQVWLYTRIFIIRKWYTI